MFKKLEIKPIHFITVILVMVLLLLHQCNRTSKLKAINNGLENKIERVKANVDAANDSVISYQNKNDYYVNEISGYQYTVAELKGENKKLLKDVDVIFTALPNGQSQIIAKNLEKKNILIDLSADFRIKNLNIYKKFYKIKHKSKKLLNKSVYGLPELYEKQIKNIIQNNTANDKLVYKT